MIESPDTPEQIPAAAISLDTYLEKIFYLSELYEFVPEDTAHAFYIWVTHAYPKICDIDGVSLLTLYKTNVIDGDMDPEVFRQYCLDNKLPALGSADAPSSEYVHEFLEFYNKHYEENTQEYALWAKEQGISIGKNAKMRFIDADGKETLVYTDPLQRGDIVEEGIE